MVVVMVETDDSGAALVTAPLRNIRLSLILLEYVTVLRTLLSPDFTEECSWWRLRQASLAARLAASLVPYKTSDLDPACGCGLSDAFEKGGGFWLLLALLLLLMVLLD